MSLPLLERRTPCGKHRLNLRRRRPFSRIAPEACGGGAKMREERHMEQGLRPEAVRAADRQADWQGHGGHPGLARYDAIRALFAETGLPPDPQTYELFWLHLGGGAPALSRELEAMLDEGRLTAERVMALRRIHLGDIAGAEMMALVEATQGSALQLADRLSRGQSDIRAYDERIAAEDSLIAASLTAQALAEAVQRLRRANAVMMAANRRLAAEIRAASHQTGRLLDRLESAERSARTDPLTGLPNRRGLAEAMKRAAVQADARGAPLSVALVDIDHFKRFNDQWGHAIGDEVLRCVGAHLAARARETAGEGAVTGRHGGEEFLVLLPGLALAEATAAMDQARDLMARQILRRASDGVSLGRLCFSAGVAALRPDDSPDTLFDRADAALYAAKRAGRDRVYPERTAE